MSNITKQNLQNLSASALESLNAVAAELGLRVSNAGGSYNGSFATLKFRVEPVVDGVLQTRELKDLKLFYPHLVGQTINWAGEEFEFTGFMPRNPKYRFLAKRIKDGLEFKLPASAADRIPSVKN